MFKLLIPLGLMAAYVLSKKGEGAQKLEYEVMGVQVYRFTLRLNLELRVSVRFLNASSQNYTVNSVRLNIKEGDTLVGDCYANQEFTIAAGTQTTVPFPVAVRGGAVLLRLGQLLAKNQPLPALTVSGFMTVEGVEKALDNVQVPLAPYDPRTPAKATTTKAPAKPAAKAPAKPAAPVVKKPAVPAKPAVKTAAKPAAKPAAHKAAPVAKKPAAPVRKPAVAVTKPSTSAPRR